MPGFISGMFAGITMQDWRAFLYPHYLHLLFFLFFCALFLDAYVLWLFWKKRERNGIPFGMAFFAVPVYAFWAWHFQRWWLLAALFGFHAVCFLILPIWRRMDFSAGMFKPGIRIFQATHRLGLCVTLGLAFWVTVTTFRSGWPVHYIYAMRGRVVDAASGKPVTYALIHDCDVGSAFLDQSGGGTSYNSVASDGDGNYYLAPRVSIFLLGNFEWRVLMLNHPMYSSGEYHGYSSDSMVMWPAAARLYRKQRDFGAVDRTVRAWNGEIRLDLPIIKLEDKYSNHKVSMDLTELYFEMRGLPQRIKMVQAKGLADKMDWKEIHASYVRMRSWFTDRMDLQNSTRLILSLEELSQENK